IQPVLIVAAYILKVAGGAGPWLWTFLPGTGDPERPASDCVLVRGLDGLLTLVQLAIAVILLLSLVLIVVLLLQAAGVLRRVPFSYNLRNLAVRWRVTLLTALAFTVVVGLMTAMLALVRGMYKLTEGSGQPDNVMVMADGASDELFSNLSYGD